MKQASQLDEHGFFITVVTVDEDPKEPGQYLLPPDCVLALPPAAADFGVRYRWDGEQFITLDASPENTVLSNARKIARASIDAAMNSVSYMPPWQMREYEDARHDAWEWMNARLPNATPSDALEAFAEYLGVTDMDEAATHILGAADKARRLRLYRRTLRLRAYTLLGQCTTPEEVLQVVQDFSETLHSGEQ